MCTFPYPHQLVVCRFILLTHIHSRTNTYTHVWQHKYMPILHAATVQSKAWSLSLSGFSVTKQHFILQSPANYQEVPSYWHFLTETKWCRPWRLKWTLLWDTDGPKCSENEQEWPQNVPKWWQIMATSYLILFMMDAAPCRPPSFGFFPVHSGWNVCLQQPALMIYWSWLYHLKSGNLHPGPPYLLKLWSSTWMELIFKIHHLKAI